MLLLHWLRLQQGLLRLYAWFCNKKGEEGGEEQCEIILEEGKESDKWAFLLS
jgi:hypothetical protein